MDCEDFSTQTFIAQNFWDGKNTQTMVLRSNVYGVFLHNVYTTASAEVLCVKFLRFDAYACRMFKRHLLATSVHCLASTVPREIRSHIRMHPDIQW